MGEPTERAPGAAEATGPAPGGDPGAGAGAPTGSGPAPRRRPELRRRLALLVLVVGVAGVVAYWSRSRPVDVEVVYEFGRHSRRVSRVEISYEQGGKEVQPVTLEFPSEAGAPKRWRHTLRLHPGSYTVRAKVHLRAVGDRDAEVKRHTRRVTVKSGEDQRLVLRLTR